MQGTHYDGNNTGPDENRHPGSIKELKYFTEQDKTKARYQQKSGPGKFFHFFVFHEIDFKILLN